jgi:hypothetical protein
MKCKVRRKKKVSDDAREPVTVRLDAEQENRLLDELTQRVEWSTNRIVDEMKPHYIVNTPQKKSDGFSLLIKCIIGIPMLIVGAAIFYYLYQNALGYWEQGFSMQFAVVMMGILGFDCIVLGIEVLREKDRNYIVALFSALVSLVALIVTLVK